MSEMMPQDYEDSTCSQMEIKIWSSVPAGTGHRDRLTDQTMSHKQSCTWLTDIP